MHLPNRDHVAAHQSYVREQMTKQRWTIWDTLMIACLTILLVSWARHLMTPASDARMSVYILIAAVCIHAVARYCLTIWRRAQEVERAWAAMDSSYRNSMARVRHEEEL